MPSVAAVSTATASIGVYPRKSASYPVGNLMNETPSSNFWKDKAVLVTGAGGFIASHLVQALLERGARLRAFVRYNSRGDPGLLRLLPKEDFERLELIAGDLRDLPAMQQAAQGVQLVFHLGALIAIP